MFIIPSPKPKYEIHRVTPISRVYTGMIGYSIFAWLPLFDDLSAHFGKDSVFMDVTGIAPGLDFRKAIDHEVSACDVLLAVIGKHWIDAIDESGNRCLDNPNDFVRLETATALKRDIPVVPVLVQGARMPRADQLPADLEALSWRNAVELTHARWDSDVELLIKALCRHLEAKHVEGGDEKSRPAVLGEPGEVPVKSDQSQRPCSEINRHRSKPYHERINSSEIEDSRGTQPQQGRVPSTNRLRLFVLIAGGIAVGIAGVYMITRYPEPPKTGAEIGAVPVPSPTDLPSSARSEATGVLPTEQRLAKDRRLRDYKVDVFWCDESGSSTRAQAISIRQNIDQAFEFARQGSVKKLVFGSGPWASGYEIRVDPDGSEEAAGKILKKYLAENFANLSFSGWPSPDPTPRYLSVFVCPRARSTEELDSRERAF